MSHLQVENLVFVRLRSVLQSTPDNLEDSAYISPLACSQNLDSLPFQPQQRIDSRNNGSTKHPAAHQAMKFTPTMPYPNNQPQSINPAALQARLRAAILALAPSAFPDSDSFRVTFRIVSLRYPSNHDFDEQGQGVQAILTSGPRWYRGRKVVAKGASAEIGREGKDVFTAALWLLAEEVLTANEEEDEKFASHWMNGGSSQTTPTQKTGAQLSADGRLTRQDSQGHPDKQVTGIRCPSAEIFDYLIGAGSGTSSDDNK